METVVDKLIEFSAGKDEELRDIAGLGVWTRELGNYACFIMIPFYLSVEDYHLGASVRRQDCPQSLREADAQTPRAASERVYCAMLDVLALSR